MRILGIDPGYAQTGWGVVESNGQQNRPVSFGVIKTGTDQSDSDRIHYIATAVGKLAVQYQVQMCGMEDIFFTKNVSSAIPVAKVIGACIHQLGIQEIPVRLYSPPTIKTVVTGYGGADKHQVQEMVRILLGFETIPKPDHASDALAAALCLAVYDFSHMRMKLV
ncbi:MAG: crossover junction endodeoxyribonuclease RuvC [Sphaerochaeta sp.]|uniref:crossover junction endodeoxyribonuclease RuvC n=1 Tax=Sphaerochaeta sp. TaxID=1972642 RepID=UPI001DE81927|nr:crossover junction endodeoxyribonuclease RuvC [uncultured Sphaerochaeta sp.]MDD3057317.1 crossover junction endodeoxyribonuclease RuvC [Sphaerochaeta sp.]MDD3929058.1 crossover junction endodeoxyribonuclease RuvC [Sphaerochaeta sp.]NCC11840.1 crossover junction endodeoxyribonuclease RuvC [Spirochaetia bacterium]NCC89029.1 crossover junction endodeoxyribonuclease RuvC [Spirochaetia bacterium]